jgi:hypothetical protein
MNQRPTKPHAKLTHIKLTPRLRFGFEPQRTRSSRRVTVLLRVLRALRGLNIGLPVPHSAFFLLPSALFHPILHAIITIDPLRAPRYNGATPCPR